MNAATVFVTLLPEHLLLLGIVLLLVVQVAGSGRGFGLALALLSVGAAALAAAVLALGGTTATPFAGHFSVTPQVLAGKAVVLALVLPVLLMARQEFDTPECASLILSSVYGVCLMQSADSFMTLFLGLEIMSMPVYALVLLAWHRTASAEAALKYLVLGGAATAMLMMGAALLFGATGSLSLDAFAGAMAAGGKASTLAHAAGVLVLAAFFVKAAIVPFHTWAPDAYEASSVPVTAYMATIVKAGVLLAVVRLAGKATFASPMLELVALLALASIVWGNLTAMRQTSLRRIIGYSGIAHAGYLFYALLGAPGQRLQSVLFYLLAYGLMNLLALAAIPPAAGSDEQRDRIDELAGLYQRNPFAAWMIALAMLSLAGIPPLPGFVAKFYVFNQVLSAGHTGYAVLGLVGSYLGIYFYLRVIQQMFMSERGAAPGPAPIGAIARTAMLLCLAAGAVVALFPGWVMARL
jgi:NADH-quinone oxidoreductase subunit N